MDFIKLCKKIIDCNGQICYQDVVDCGYGPDLFVRLTHPSVKPERIVKNAYRSLADRGIHYKENVCVN